MNKQVKINIKDKDYYCDMEVLKLIERLQDKIELLEYNRDKAIEIIDLIKPELWNISNKMTYRLIDIKNILEGSEKNNE